MRFDFYDGTSRGHRQHCKRRCDDEQKAPFARDLVAGGRPVSAVAARTVLA
jgi:hypothetical protein